LEKNRVTGEEMTKLFTGGLRQLRGAGVTEKNFLVMKLERGFVGDRGGKEVGTHLSYIRKRSNFGLVAEAPWLGGTGSKLGGNKKKKTEKFSTNKKKGGATSGRGGGN